MRSDLPSGTVTFLFTDVEGSTKLLHSLGAEGYAAALAEHRLVLRRTSASHGGVEVDTQGDAFFFAFPTAPGALAAAEEMTRKLASGTIQVRIGLHTGTPLLTAEGYVGGDIHRAARIAAAGHGGQVLVSSSTAQLVEIELTDLGEHRLKDLSAPERIYQLVEGDFPALKSLYRTNLPVSSTPFLGRERELAEVVGLLDGTRLLTLTGPGGTGKTRLAAQAAGMASDGYLDGVWWVPLAPLREPALVLETAAQVVGSKNGLAEHIAGKSMLLLLDNFEQVVEAAGDVSGLLSSCPNLDLLVTSREPLHVTAEQEYPVPPLVHQEGVGFFLARARAVEPGFTADQAVSEICSRLDDLPLALELAAARVKALSSAQILERLEQRLPLLTGGARDLPERQRTLRGAIAWSYELLHEAEQRLFARLAVFRGGCTLEAAEEVAEADLDTLQSLVDKSLLRHSDERFWMLETIREYAAERLEELGEGDELRHRHADRFLALAEQAAPHLVGDVSWIRLLDVELDNVRAALDLSVRVDPQHALRTTAALEDYWAMRGQILEARTRLEGALAADPQPTRARCHALIKASNAATIAGDDAAARAHIDEALELSNALDDIHLVALARLGHAWLLAEERDWSGAREILEDVLPVFREVGDSDTLIRATRTLAWMCEELGDYERYRALTEENLERAREHGHRRIEARSLGSLGVWALDDGRLDDARMFMVQSFRIDEELGNLLFLMVDLVRLAWLSEREGSPELAAQLLSRAAALRDEMGYALESWMVAEYDQTLAAVREQLADTVFDEAWEAGAGLSLDEAFALALEP